MVVGKHEESSPAEIKKVQMEEPAALLFYLKKLLAPFLHAYDFFMQTVKNIKQTWRTSVSGSVFEFVLLFKGQTTIIPPAVL